MAKTLREAAEEVLNATRAAAPRENMHKQALDRPWAPQPGSDIHDLGGATPSNPGGGKLTVVGPSATPPGILPDPGNKEPMHNVRKERGEELKGTPDLGHPTVNQLSSDGEQPATGGSMTGTDYVHPTLNAPGNNPSAVAHDPEFHEEYEPTEEELAEAHKEKMEKVKMKMKSKSCKEDIDAIFKGESISEEFRTRLETIFEAAVVTRAVEVVEDMEKEILAAAEDTVNEIKAELEEQVGGYLEMVVQEWMEQNKLQVEAGLKTEITEDFISDLRDLFNKHNIDVPAEKVDVIEQLTAKVDDLTAKLNTTMDQNATLNKQVNEGKKVKITEAVCVGLTATQAAKVKSLAEGVDFSTEADYEKKLKAIREGYFTTASDKPVKSDAVANHVVLAETADAPAEEPTEQKPAGEHPQMAAYARALKYTSQ